MAREMAPVSAFRTERRARPVRLRMAVRIRIYEVDAFLFHVGARSGAVMHEGERGPTT